MNADAKTKLVTSFILLFSLTCSVVLIVAYFIMFRPADASEIHCLTGYHEQSERCVRTGWNPDL